MVFYRKTPCFILPQIEPEMMTATRAMPASRPASRTAAPNWKSLSVWALYFVGLLPAAWYFYQGATGSLGADPVKTFEHLLGLWALRFLIAGLAVTPLLVLFGIRLIAWRRALGLLAFYYVVMHFLVYMVLDQSMNLSAVLTDITRRPYIIIGMAAFVLLMPLALTSNAWSIRRLGPAWRKLHTLVYVIVAAGVLHFAMSVKSITTHEMVYIVLVALLLLFRPFKPAIMKWKRARRAQAR